MAYSKTKIDKSGALLSVPDVELDEAWLEADEVFESYRRDHLRPLSELTSNLQRLLDATGTNYYLAQRLKRKPQILRKLNRFSVRLTQLQDIGGNRVILNDNRDVDAIAANIDSFSEQKLGASIKRRVDYREFGREDSGYRALHYIFDIEGFQTELQLRSNIQHYWAEAVERASVVYGHHLKELDGDPIVISYFKMFSNLLYEIEVGRPLSQINLIAIEKARGQAEAIIERSDRENVFGSYVNEGIIKSLVEVESSRKGSLNNWILVFDWNVGAFVTWEIVGRNPEDAVDSYMRYERDFPSERKFEVVLIGSSDISTVRQTHSHYFGIEYHNTALESFERSIIGIDKRANLDIGAKRILSVMVRKRFWGTKTINADTLRNHFCRDVYDFEDSLDSLKLKDYVRTSPLNGGLSLNMALKAKIERHL